MAIAVTLGGPGAVLWCWFMGVFGMATKYAEVLLSMKYREVTPSGHILGGPMYTLKNGLKMNGMASLFCFFTALAAFGLGNTVPANAISGVLESSLSIPTYITGIVLSLIVFVVIVGGVKSIARVSSRLIPFMTIFYIIGCVIILIINHSYFVDSLILIFKSAFSSQAAGGGFIGSSVMLAARIGVMRGLYSNESGILAVAARSRNPVRQGLVSMTGTFGILL